MKNLITLDDGSKVQDGKNKRLGWATFSLEMDKINSWDGNWSGQNSLHVVLRAGLDRYRMLREGVYYYQFDDGWRAKIEVRFTTFEDAYDLYKKSTGFCGLEWMVDSICNLGKIVCPRDP